MNVFFGLLCSIFFATLQPAAAQVPASRANQILSIFNEFKVVYGPLARNSGARLQMDLWLQSPIVNATGNEYREPGLRWQIIIYGGLAKYPRLTADGFRFLICHELGHILGGAPTWDDFSNSQIRNSNAGQPDYYAATVCMKLILRNHDSVQALRSVKIHPRIAQLCKSQHREAQDQAICVRTARAAAELLGVLADLGASPPLSFDKASSERATTLIPAHPDLQCRLDTVIRGMLCRYSPKGVSRDEGDIANAACQSPALGTGRPICWLPSQYDGR